MISFRVDSRSGVPPYLQIVQQVRQALRMGVLDAGALHVLWGNPAGLTGFRNCVVTQPAR